MGCVCCVVCCVLCGVRVCGRELKQQRSTIVLVEQNFNMARALGDTVAVMDNGRVVHSGAMQALADDQALQQHLLGLALGGRA